MWTTMPSPVGQLRLVADVDALLAVGFEPFGPPADGRPVGERDDDDPILAEAVRQLSAYFAGELTDFDLPLAPTGTAYQQRVWEALRGIGYGETATYGDVARRIGQTTAASRAVGLATGRNPIPIIVACHRVVGSDGSLTGYAGGVDRKRALLDLEQAALF